MEPLDLIPSSFSWAAVWTDGKQTCIEWATSRADAASRLGYYRSKPGVCLVARVHPPGRKATVTLDGVASLENAGAVR
jgi:hypothetical protein